MSNSSLFRRVPLIWGRLDSEGIFENFCDVLDSGFDTEEELVQALLDIHSSDRIRDRYVRLLAEICGHLWRESKTYAWNRTRIRNSVSWNSYKGAWARLGDIIERCGGTTWSSVDMNEVLIAPGVNGRWGYPDNYWSDANFYHPGARHLIVDSGADLDELEYELEFIRAAGEKWYITVED